MDRFMPRSFLFPGIIGGSLAGWLLPDITNLFSGADPPQQHITGTAVQHGLPEPTGALVEGISNDSSPTFSIPADLLLFTTFIATTTLLLLRNIFQSNELSRQRNLRRRRRQARLNPEMDIDEDLIPEDSSVDQEARITKAIRVAALLRQKLPADLVPTVLDYAQLWSTIAIARRFRKERVDESRAGLVALTCKLPTNMPLHTVRRIRITTESRDQGWSSDGNGQGTYDNSWTWFELGLRQAAELDQVSGGADEGNLFVGRDGDTVRRTRVITNVHARRQWKTHVVIWDVTNESEGIRDTLLRARAGDVIELSVWARFPMWENFLKFVRIEVEGICIRRL